MKKMRFLGLLMVIFFVNVASTCSNDDDGSNNTNPDPTPVINTALNGTWRITNYVDSGTDKTSQFSGFNFTFGANNILTVTGNGLTYSGSWSVTSDNSNDDDSLDADLDFNILFTSPALFAELSDDWDIVSYNNNSIQLIDISGGNGGTDNLTFTKN